MSVRRSSPRRAQVSVLLPAHFVHGIAEMSRHVEPVVRDLVRRPAGRPPSPRCTPATCPSPPSRSLNARPPTTTRSTKTESPCRDRPPHGERAAHPRCPPQPSRTRDASETTSRPRRDSETRAPGRDAPDHASPPSASHRPPGPNSSPAAAAHCLHARLAQPVNDQGLEQRRETRACIRPRHADRVHSVLRAAHPRHVRRQDRPVLARRQMPPAPADANRDDSPSRRTRGNGTTRPGHEPRTPPPPRPQAATRRSSPPKDSRHPESDRTSLCLASRETTASPPSTRKSPFSKPKFWAFRGFVTADSRCGA